MKDRRYSPGTINRNEFRFRVPTNSEGIQCEVGDLMGDEFLLNNRKYLYVINNFLKSGGREFPQRVGSPAASRGQKSLPPNGTF